MITIIILINTVIIIKNVSPFGKNIRSIILCLMANHNAVYGSGIELTKTLQLPNNCTKFNH